MPDSPLPRPLPPAETLRDDVIELRPLRVLGPGDVRSPAARFLEPAPECRFAIHRRSDGLRVGRIHLRITDDPAIVESIGHSGYEIDEHHRRLGYASRALNLIRGLARYYAVAPPWVFISPDNEASRRTAERAGLHLVDVVAASPNALGLGLDPLLCRYAVERP